MEGTTLRVGVVSLLHELSILSLVASHFDKIRGI